MYAWAIRRERHGEPDTAMQVEVVPTWELDSHDVLVLVMAAGVNYNGVWAALGTPISPFDGHKAPYHIAGSDASGIVWAVGSKVKRWKVGDEVVIHCNQDDGDDEECNGGDPMFSPSQRIWGYETPDGSFAQFTRVQDRQLMERPKHLTWEEAACYTLTLATAYRMLFGHRPHILRPGHNVLVWGASGGLGSFAIQLCATAGANAIGVVSDDDKRDFVMQLGAKGVINRKKFNCWGQLPKVGSAEGLDRRGTQVRKGDLGHHRKGRQRRLRVRASGRVDVPAVRVAGETRRHGGDLRWHDRLQSDDGCAVSLDAPEACPGQPFRQPSASRAGQQAGRRAADRSVHVGSLRLGPDPESPHADAEEPAQARQHGRPGECADDRTSHL
jgi:crotonyl-CoA carboxylase/reductase